VTAWLTSVAAACASIDVTCPPGALPRIMP
jgi:hypothetical protein